MRGGGQCSSTADISTATNTSIDTTTCSTTSTTNGEGGWGQHGRTQESQVSLGSHEGRGLLSSSVGMF